MGNLDIWQKVHQPDKKYLQEIKFGNLKGKSDINPQWRMMAMTEVFGPCGIGWGYRVEKFWEKENEATKEIMCFCQVAVWYVLDGKQSQEIPGIGGSMLVDKNKNGLVSNDEAYKMATTDALSVAFKSIGVAADVYLGNYDGSKYQGQPQQQPQNQQPRQKTPQEIEKDRLKEAINFAPTADEIDATLDLEKASIEALPKVWQTALYAMASTRREALTA